MVRAGIHTLRLLLPEQSLFEKKEQQLLERIRKLEAKQVDKLGGRQQYVKELIDLSVHKRRMQGLLGAGGTDKKIVARHGKSWAKMSVKAKASYDFSAWKSRRQKRAQIAEQVKAAREA